jgi:hypothetical protein
MLFEQQCRHFNGIIMHPMLNTAIKAARRAAAIINRASFDLDRVKVTEKVTGTMSPKSTRRLNRRLSMC